MTSTSSRGGDGAPSLPSGSASSTAILIRSGTRMTEELIGRAHRLQRHRARRNRRRQRRPRCGDARGIVVANAPQSNSVAAAEHTLAMTLALCRHVPQAHGSLALASGRDRKLQGDELYEKTLGVIGFGRIGQLVAKRAAAFGMEVSRSTSSSPPSASASSASRGPRPPTRSTPGRIVTIHLPKTPDTAGWLDAEAIARMREGVRIVNCARGELVDDGAPRGARVGEGRRCRARRLPLRAVHRASDIRPRRRRRHAAPRRLDRRGPGQGRRRHGAAGPRGADRRRGHERRQHPCRPARGHGGARPVHAALRAAGRARAGARQRVRGPGRGGVPGQLAERDTRLLGVAVLVGVLAGHTEEPVNLVNAPAPRRGARDRRRRDERDTGARDFTELFAVEIVSGGRAVRVVGTASGRRNRPHLFEVWGQRFDVQLEEHIAMFRYRDLPGMVGRVGRRSASTASTSSRRRLAADEETGATRR